MKNDIKYVQLPHLSWKFCIQLIEFRFRVNQNKFFIPPFVVNNINESIIQDILVDSKQKDI